MTFQTTGRHSSWMFLALLFSLGIYYLSCGGSNGSASASGGSSSGSSGSGTSSTAPGIVVVGNSESPSYPVTNGSSYISGGDGEDGALSILQTGGSGGSSALAFSEFLGGTEGSGGTQLRAVWVDPGSGDIFVGGRTGGAGVSFPVTAGVFQPTYAGGPDDALICRFSGVGVERWCSYLGTSGANVEETVYGIAGFDPNGNLTVCGRMNPIANGTRFDGIVATRIGPANEIEDQAYAAKIKPDGSALVWYTGFGGSGGDGNRGRCVLDAQGNVYGEGDTESIDFPVTAGAYQTVNRSTASTSGIGMVYKMSADGSHLIWASYLGGSGVSDIGDVAEGGLILDANDDLYVAASTPGSANFFLNGATGFQSSLLAGNGLGACAIAEFSPDGSKLLHSTFLSGKTGGVSTSTNRLDTECDGINLDSNGNVVVEGFTTYSDFPTTAGALKTTKPSSSPASSGFVTKFSADLSTLIASTYIGGSGSETEDNSSDVCFDSSGNVFSMLSSLSPDFPTTTDAYSSQFIGQGYDIVVFGLSSDLKTLIYGSFLGGMTPATDNGVSAGNWPWSMALILH